MKKPLIVWTYYHPETNKIAYFRGDEKVNPLEWSVADLDGAEFDRAFEQGYVILYKKKDPGI